MSKKRVRALKAQKKMNRDIASLKSYGERQPARSYIKNTHRAKKGKASQ